MKPNPLSFAGTILLIFLCTSINAQNFGTSASAVWITDCNQSNFFNTSGSSPDLIGPVANTFDNANLGVHTQNSGTLILRGAQVRTFKNPAGSNVCSAKMYYRVYLQSTTPGAFTAVDLPFLEDCSGGTFPSGGTCNPGDQKWQQLSPSLVNLTTFSPGNYVLEVYYEVSGSNTATTGCADLVTLNNSGNNYKATFFIQSPNLTSTNPSSCFGNGGSITIGGLRPGASYLLSYTDDGVNVGPNVFVANSSGQVIIPGLNKGFYSNFILQINGCSTNLFTGIILSDPIYVPIFTPVPPICAGATAPVLPATSNNGLTGTWSPSVVDNQNSGTYTFTPNANQCGIAVTITVNVIPNVTPAFGFGTSLVICENGSVPVLPNTSTNGITGSWSPSVVDNQNSGSYTFTPTAGQCAAPTVFTVTVNPNITPTFDFGTSATICAGDGVPSLPGVSTNGINGTWSPSVVDNQHSGSYTFTPTAGQCAVTATFDVTVNPVLTPAFSFGTSSSICAGGSVPVLPATSTNGINGTWNPSVVNDMVSGTYTFTPTAGQCATTTTFTITVDPNIPPVFTFGTSLTICAGGSVPALPSNSTNGISGSWSPATVDNQNSATYTFTPTAGQCATITTFAVTVNPNITPTFDFGTSIAICVGDAVPSLPATSANGITGTWSPSTVSNQNSGTYTFTPNAGQCAINATLSVTVSSNIVPAFNFGPALSVCVGGTVPALPTTSSNGIDGVWNPSVVDNQNSGTYLFTPSVTGPCVKTFTFTVTVNQPVTPAFDFGVFQSVCIGAPAPALPLTSLDGITGTWNPSVVDNQNSGVYTFTPGAGQCANTTTLTYEVNPVPSITMSSDTTVYDGDVLPLFQFTSTAGSVVNWSNNNPSIGLTASGRDDIPSFTAINKGNAEVIAIITATPSINGCSGAAQSRMIKVLPLDKDVFVPNVFSPNGDGKNDILYVYGNYIDKVDMRIFNQWGQQIAVVSNKSQGWDGRHKGNPQPVGVYVYVLKAEMIDGTVVNKKGSVTLVR